MSSSNHSQITPNGVAWAAILAAGIGCFAFGVLIDCAEGSKRISALFNFYDPVGNLSGKSSLAILVWVVSWVILHQRWKHRQIRATGTLTTVTVLLVLLGIVASCPLCFGMFAVR